MTDEHRPILPRIACPSWCDLAREEFHRSDYDSSTAAGLLARVHSTTVAVVGSTSVDLQALETANPDGSSPLVDPASIAVYGLEDGPQLTPADALALADALRAAAARLPLLDQGPRS